LTHSLLFLSTDEKASYCSAGSTPAITAIVTVS
jgi:hypothetical protein